MEEILNDKINNYTKDKCQNIVTVLFFIFIILFLGPIVYIILFVESGSYLLKTNIIDLILTIYVVLFIAWVIGYSIYLPNFLKKAISTEIVEEIDISLEDNDLFKVTILNLLLEGAVMNPKTKEKIILNNLSVVTPNIIDLKSLKVLGYKIKAEDKVYKKLKLKKEDIYYFIKEIN